MNTTSYIAIGPSPLTKKLFGVVLQYLEDHVRYRKSIMAEKPSFESSLITGLMK